MLNDDNDVLRNDGHDHEIIMAADTAVDEGCSNSTSNGSILHRHHHQQQHQYCLGRSDDEDDTDDRDQQERQLTNGGGGSSNNSDNSITIEDAIGTYVTCCTFWSVFCCCYCREIFIFKRLAREFVSKDKK